MTELELMTKGFNAGYLLQKHSPHLSEAIQEGLKSKNKPYVKGFAAGVIECLKEQGIDKWIDWELGDEYEHE